jgi:nicotinamide mononucleotide transporter
VSGDAGRLRAAAWTALGAATVLLAAGVRGRALPIGLDEVFGFATGAACVLLVVEENVWNFPVGLANNLFFLALFWRSRLYGDMSLQLVYIALGLLGWWHWTRRPSPSESVRVSSVPVACASAGERGALVVFAVAAVPLLRTLLQRANGAAPFLDAVTTVLSLIAQWLLNRKRIENWYAWIAADVIYVYLYFERHLPLTALLYAVFIPMCAAGLVRWRRTLARATVRAAAA